MAIAHGSTTAANNSSTSQLNITNVPVTGSNAVLVVLIAYKSGTAGKISRVTWDSAGVGEGLTLLGSEVGSGNSNSSIYYLPAPTAQTATVTIDLTANKRIVAAAQVYTGVHQGAPFRTASFASATGTDNNPTVNVVALDTEMVLDSLCQISGGPDTISANSGTLRHNDPATGGGTDTRGAGQEIASSGATETMEYTLSSTDDWGITACALQPPAVTATRFQLNISDNWESIESIQINIGDVWKAVEGAKINISDDWKLMFET